MIYLCFYGKSNSIEGILSDLPTGVEAVAVNIEQPSYDSAFMCPFAGLELESLDFSNLLLAKLELHEVLILDEVQVYLHITVNDHSGFKLQTEVMSRLVELNIGLVVASRESMR